MEEPSDEMLSCIMREAAAEADMRWKSAEKKFFEQLQDMILKTTSPTALWPDTDLCWLLLPDLTGRAKLQSLQKFWSTNDWRILSISIRIRWHRNVSVTGIHRKPSGKQLNIVLTGANVVLSRITAWFLTIRRAGLRFSDFFFLRPQINVKAVLTVINPNGIYRIQQ